MTRRYEHCEGCGTRLGARNTSGLCRGCVFRRLCSDRDWVERRSAAQRVWRQRPENRARVHAQVTQASRQRLAWCPLEYRDDYRRLTRAIGLTAAEARAAIEETVARDAVRSARTGTLQRTREGGL